MLISSILIYTIALQIFCLKIDTSLKKWMIIHQHAMVVGSFVLSLGLKK